MAGAVIGIGALFLIFATAAIVVVQAYWFLKTGTWVWYSAAHLLYLSGTDVRSLYDGLDIPDWPGMTKIFRWVLFECPASCLTVGVGTILIWIGVASEE